MKHRILPLILLICLMLTISACAGTGPAENTAEPEPTAVPEPSPEADDRRDPEPAAPPSTLLTDAIAVFPGLSAEETAAMNNWAEYGFGLIDGSTYYGRFFLRGEPAPMFFSIELKSSKYDVMADRWQVLDSEHSPKYVIKQDDVLYYIMLDRTAGTSLGIARVCTDGNDFRVLYEGGCDYLSLAGETLFFTDADGYPACISVEGGDPRVLFERKAFYLYGISEDWLIFQDDADGETLHLFHISDGADIKLTHEAGFYPVIYGTSLFFSVRDPERQGAYRIACSNLSAYSERYDEDADRFEPVFTTEYGGQPFGGEFYICGDTIRAMNGSEPIEISSWPELGDDAYKGFSRIVRFVSDSWMVEEITGKDSSITAMMFHDRSGRFASKVPWLS